LDYFYVLSLGCNANSIINQHPGDAKPILVFTPVVAMPNQLSPTEKQSRLLKAYHWVSNKSQYAKMIDKWTDMHGVH